jgi:hypothetical protein
LPLFVNVVVDTVIVVVAINIVGDAVAVILRISQLVNSIKWPLRSSKNTYISILGVRNTIVVVIVVIVVVDSVVVEVVIALNGAREGSLSGHASRQIRPYCLCNTGCGRDCCRYSRTLHERSFGRSGRGA